MSRDYSKGKIYIIRNTVNDLTYIGSTCQTLARRMIQHRSATKNNKQQHYKLYQAMNEVGKDAFYIELIEDYPCQTLDELLKREGEKIKEYEGKLNQSISGRSKKEYRQDNKEKLAEKSKQDYQENKEKRRETKKLYRETNKEKAKEYQKKNYKANSERILERNRQNYHKNKDKINEKRRQDYPKNKATKALYRERTKVVRAERDKQYYQKNIDKVLQREKERYEKNREQILERRNQ